MYHRKTVKLDPVLRPLTPLAMIIESKHPKALLLDTTDFYDCYADVCVYKHTWGSQGSSPMALFETNSLLLHTPRLADSQASGDSVLGLQGRTTARGILGILEIQTRALTCNSLAVFSQEVNVGYRGINGKPHLV